MVRAINNVKYQIAIRDKLRIKRITQIGSSDFYLMDKFVMSAEKIILELLFPSLAISSPYGKQLMSC